MNQFSGIWVYMYMYVHLWGKASSFHFFLFSASCILPELSMVLVMALSWPGSPNSCLLFKYGSNFLLADSNKSQVCSVITRVTPEVLFTLKTWSCGSNLMQSPDFRTNCALASADKIWRLRLFSRFFFYTCSCFNLVGTLSDVLENFFG